MSRGLRAPHAEERFVLHYQPIVSLATGEIVHLEALLRWNHPTRGLVAPGDFITLAEETALIVPLGDWVLDQVCRQIAEWRARAFESSVMINVASKQFSQPTFVEDVAAALERAGVPPASLGIEVTEGVAMDPRAIDTCKRLAELGVQLALDDFGTGYSSLSYLTRMPVRALKIDRSFVSRMSTDPMSTAIVQTIITLASSLGLATIAEGIETAEEAARLRDMKCAYGQGFYWSRAVEPNAVIALVLGASKAAAA